MSLGGRAQLDKVGGATSLPPDSPLGKILKDWSNHSYSSLTEKKTVFYCNTTWLMYDLEGGEKMTANKGPEAPGSLRTPVTAASQDAGDDQERGLG